MQRSKLDLILVISVLDSLITLGMDVRETRFTFRSHFGKCFDKRPLKDSYFVGCNTVALIYSDISFTFEKN